uniref:Epidermal growth factor receptor substrate 15-like 1 n=1 Tax=Salarias fasciatus TaxID=181472 RepID=A0A672JS56_SALFA
MTLSQLSSGNPVYENLYRQLDPGNTGKISAGDAAQFLKRSGLSDSTLGKIWDLADSERRGYLDKRGFFVALRLVASAQGGNDISLNNLNQNLAAPKFRDTSSPLLTVSAPASDSQWAIRPDEKGKFEGIFESLSPVNGLLPGEKVRPVLINSKLPLDVLGKIWDLSDVDKDGYLDKEEFIVAMHLVYRAMEKDPVPTTLPTSLIPPSKRKKSAVGLPGAVAVLPALSGLTPGSTPLKETLRSTPPLSSTTPLIPSAVSLSPQHSFKSPSQPSVNWAVPVADRERYDEIFRKTDSDNDGLVTGGEVIEIFMQSSLSQTMLAQIWGLADTKQTGKLSREQFSVAMYLIQQKVKKGIDPPSTLPPDLIPPSERTADSTSSTGSVELTGIKELDDLSQEIAQLQREKFILEQEIKEKEETIRQKNSDVLDMQNDLDRESSNLQDLESQKQDAQERLEEMDQQRSKLEGMLNDVKQKCQEESQMISSLQSQIRSQETDLRSQEDDLSRTKADLSRLQEEEAQLEQSLLSGRVQLDSIIKSLKTTQEEINQVGELRLSRSFLSGGVAVGLALSADPFGGDPFKESDPFKGTSSEDFYKKTDKSDLFGSADPFGRKPTPPVKVSSRCFVSAAPILQTKHTFLVVTPTWPLYACLYSKCPLLSFFFPPLSFSSPQPSAFSSDPFSSNSTKQNSGMFVRVFDTLRLHIKSSEMHACVCACQQVVNSE